MKIKRLTLKNFRQFSDINIDFEKDITVLVGINGSGKTTVMDALAIALGTAFRELDDIKEKSIQKQDVRLQSYQIGASEDVQSQYPVHISVTAQCDGLDIDWMRALNSDKGKTTIKDANSIINIFREYQNRLRKGDVSLVLPIFAYYGTGRIWDYHREKKTNVFKTNNRTNGYIDCLDGTANIKLMLNWFRKQTIEKMERLERGDIISPVLDAVYAAMEKSYSLATKHDEVKIRYSLNTNELIVYYTDDNGMKMHISLNQMSDGYKSTISLVTDIAYRMAILNPQFGNDTIKETTGIVLIDEVDLHLHPAWQQRILDDLRTIFPKVQFIVSTHAPAVIHSINANHLRIIKDNHVESSPLESYGKDANGIFRAVMGVPERPAVVMERFQEFHNALDDENYDKAENVLNELEKLIGEDPEIAACRMQLELEQM